MGFRSLLVGSFTAWVLFAGVGCSGAAAGRESLSKLQSLLPPDLVEEPKEPLHENGWLVWSESRDWLRRPVYGGLDRSLLSEPTLTQDQIQAITEWAKKDDDLIKAMDASLKVETWSAPDTTAQQRPLLEAANMRLACRNRCLLGRALSIQGKRSEGMSHIEACLRFGLRVRRSSRALDKLQESISIGTTALAALNAELRSGRFDSMAGDASALLEEVAGQDQGFAQALRGEFRQSVLPVLASAEHPDPLRRHPKDSPFRGRFSQVEMLSSTILRGHNNSLDRGASLKVAVRLAEQALKLDHEFDAGVMKSLGEDVSALTTGWPKQMRRRNFWSIMATPDEMDQSAEVMRDVANPYGNLLVGLVLERMPPTLKSLWRHRAIIQQSLWLAKWVKEGRKTKPQVADPFSKQPLKADLKRGVLWSVDFDGVDDGGASAPNRIDPDSRDLVISVR